MARFGSALCWTALFLVLVFLLAPILIVIAVSFSPSAIFAFPPEGFSFRWYEAVGRTDLLVSSFWLSVQIAFLSTCISLLLGTLCSIAIVRGYIPGGTAVATFMASPLMLPGLVFGIAFLQTARAIGLWDSYTTLLMAHVVITMPFVMRTVLASLSLSLPWSTRRGCSAAPIRPLCGRCSSRISCQASSVARSSPLS